MKFFTLLIAAFFAVQLNAQDVKGYYITVSGNKTEGFFKYGDFYDAESLKFKQSRNDDYKGFSNDVVEYGMYDDNLKFEKHVVQVDVSGNDSFEKNPELQTRTVFLNVLIEGNATLYSYTKDYKTIFFFNTKAKPQEVTHLIYKKYKISDSETKENTGFRQQLYNAVRCDGQYVSDFKDIMYDKKQLMDVFKNYNSCKGYKSVIYGPKKKSGFNYSVFAGVNNLNVGISYAFPAVDNQSKINYNFGSEVTYVFHSERPALFFRVEYELLTSDVVDSYDQGYNVLESTYKIKGSALNFIFGPRYNFLLSEKSSILADAGFCFSQPFGDIKKTTIIYPVNNGEPYSGDHNEYNLTTGFGINLGVGYTFDKKYGIVFRYLTNRNYLEGQHSSFKTKINRVGIEFKYTFY
ncbi:hypothetical protein [Flavobacterium sp. NRK1]|uniref:hypothetical protein n=1 Tax=Flavobacterium sp. NRK1 TaxID=2954929 RepID=UPI002092957D|nr:hypothetical protein [Flavobacterium sp. NRK1]MCO6146709.1 hypothetical protein [Flavobacterium sp. NRK1]